MGVLVFGVNDGNDEGEYPGVQWLQHLGRCDLDSLRMIEEGGIVPYKKGKGDWVTALEAAADDIAERVGTKKFKKRVFLITDGESKVASGKKELARVQDLLN